MIDVAAKCHAPFLTRFWAQYEMDGSLTAEWLNVWALLSLRMNPPHITVIPVTWNTYASTFTNERIWKPRGRSEQRELLNDGYTTPCELRLLRRTNNGKYVTCRFRQILTGH